MNKTQLQKSATVRQYSEYMRAYDHFNQSLFGNSLPDIMLAFAPGKSPKTEAYTIPEKWEGESNLNQISISPEAFHKHDFQGIMVLLVREMCKHSHMVKNPSSRVTKGKALTYCDTDLAERYKLAGLVPYQLKADGSVNREQETGQGITVDVLKGGAFDKAFKAMPDEIRLPWQAVPEYRKPVNTSKAKQTRVKYVALAGSDEQVQVWAKPGLDIKVKVGNKFVPAVPESKDDSKDKEQAA